VVLTLQEWYLPRLSTLMAPMVHSPERTLNGLGNTKKQVVNSNSIMIIITELNNVKSNIS